MSVGEGVLEVYGDGVAVEVKQEINLVPEHPVSVLRLGEVGKITGP